MSFKPELSSAISEEEFLNNYWYVTELKAFAMAIGIRRSSKLRKDQLEESILIFIRSGRVTQVERKQDTTGIARDSDGRIHRDLRIVRYTNDSQTKDFLYSSLRDVNLKPKSGAMYRLNRWREAQIDAGRQITYGDLAYHYIQLCQHEGSFKTVPSGRYINFCAEFLKNEINAKHSDARKVWGDLKKLPIPKTYSAWKSHTSRR